MRVLAADNSPTAGYVLNACLKSLDHYVTQVQVGEEVIKNLRSVPYDLVICDATMGDMDGIEIVKSIRADAAIAHIPFIIMMPNPDERAVAAAKEAGATGCLAKPFDTNMLEEAIKAAMPR